MATFKYIVRAGDAVHRWMLHVDNILSFVNNTVKSEKNIVLKTI